MDSEGRNVPVRGFELLHAKIPGIGRFPMRSRPVLRMVAAFLLNGVARHSCQRCWWDVDREFGACWSLSHRFHTDVAEPIRKLSLYFYR